MLVATKQEANRTSHEFQYPVPRWPCAAPVQRHSLGNLCPTFLDELIPGCPNMFRAECELFMLIPRLNTRDCRIRIRPGVKVLVCQPMHSRQKLHAVRGLKAFDQGRDAL